MTGPGRLAFSRRAALLAPLPLVRRGSEARRAASPLRIDVSQPGVPFRREDTGIVGVYDVDLLLRPEFGRLLDIFAASPGAISGVRFFGIFTAGQAEAYRPESGGTVWTDPDGPFDFRLPLAALEALTTRGMTPFIALGFFPPAVSPSPIAPPARFDDWQRLVRAFLTALADDPRFGADRIRDWWFEVWNEPNEGRFWSGTQEEYLALYRATAAAVAETGLPVRLGGPAIAYKPQAGPDDGAPWMGTFLEYVASDPDTRCDFVSLHRKGTVGDDPPDPRRLREAAQVTRAQMDAIAPERFAGVPVINDEADEKVGFEVPYAPRMDQTNASWLAAVCAIEGALAAETGARFMAAADNANLQLVEEPFDGRRSLLTYSLAGSDELVKVSAFAFYELLRLLEGRQARIAAGSEQLAPVTDLYHLTVAGKQQIGTLLTWYPAPGAKAAGRRSLDVMIEGIPWDTVNVACYRIDGEHANAYATAGGSAANPYPKPDRDLLPAIRLAQEVGLERPIQRRVRVDGGTWREAVDLEPYATVLIQITPVSEDVPAPPAEVTIARLADRTEVRWTPSADPSFHSYEVWRDGERIGPDPLRAAFWTDGPVPPGTRYRIRVISTTGIASTYIEQE